MRRSLRLNSSLSCLISLLILVLAVPVLAAQINPRYQNYVPPTKIGWDAAEPSIGCNWSNGNVMYQAGLETLRVSFDDSTSPARTNWVSTEAELCSLASLDPVLFTDSRTNRTFVSQLDAGCSITSFTNNDGASWTGSTGCGVPAGVDHQTIGGGPYAVGTLAIPLTSYPNTVYYCSQDLVTAFCSRSDNGGLIFGAGVPIYTLAQCGGIHGRVKVGPDGTVYVPNSNCTGGQGVAVSENNGLSWTVRTVSGSVAADTDPSVAVGAANTLYFGYVNAGHPRVVVSKDHGKTWISNKDVGTSFAIQNTVFPAVVAGDDNRAAFAFLGTPTAGNYQDAANFTGIWHLYISVTYDGGTSWTTVNATPNDPVQVGSIRIQEGVEPAGRHFTTGLDTPLLDRGDRNLLDFINATADKQGRLVVAYADGCVNGCVTTPSSALSRSAMATIARQSGGKRLYAAYDPVEPSKPAAPLLSGNRDSTGVHLSWSQPDNGGSAITKYRIYRGTVSGGETLLKTQTSRTYNDKSVSKGITYYYRVSALNSIGEGPQSNELAFP